MAEVGGDARAIKGDDDKVKMERASPVWIKQPLADLCVMYAVM